MADSSDATPRPRPRMRSSAPSVDMTSPPESAAEQEAPSGSGRWTLGIADVGVQGAKTGRGVESHPNAYATTAVQTEANRQQAVNLSTPLSYGGRPATGSAALLMAASALAQTPAQSVSNALLGQVQSVAAEELQRRSSLPGAGAHDPQQTPIGPSSADPPAMMHGSIDRQYLQPSTSAHSVRSSDVEQSGPFRQRRRSSLVSVVPTTPSMVVPSSSLPPSPRSAATQQVGSIATKAAAKEYLVQSSLLSKVSDATSSAILNSSPSIGSSMAYQISQRLWDESNPLQGVPSMPLTPSASLAMLPPSNLSMSMKTPLSPEESGHSSYFRPSYRLAAEEYEILASAAAIATVALTTATSETDQSSDDVRTQGSPFADAKGRTSRPLTASEQEEIAATLRAWAGLDGAKRQEEARKKLQQHQSELNQMRGSDSPAQTQFFPPDFARHYQSQLTALAVGYYQKLHSDGLTEPQWAPSVDVSSNQMRQHQQQQQYGRRPSTSGSLTTASLLANTGTTSEDFVRLQKDAMHVQNQNKAVAAARELFGRDLSGAIQPPPPPPQQPPQHQSQAQSQQQVPLCSSMVTLATANNTAESNSLDPLQLIAHASNAAGLDVNSPEVRDHLLQYAHHLYATGSTTAEVDGTGENAARTAEFPASDKETKNQTKTKTIVHPTLLPLLHTLHNLHPQHLPTLLLLSCAYYSNGDLAASLWYNKLILQIDPNYIESMSNIGTTLRALGRWKEAESWWRRAIELRPGYWDAYENLLGVLCSPHQVPPNSDDREQNANGTEKTNSIQGNGPRFGEALRLCDFVESRVLAMHGGIDENDRTRKLPGGGEHPLCMPKHLPFSQATRLQNLLYAKGNLKYVLPEYGTLAAAREYQRAIEMMLSSSEQFAYSVRDLVVATYVVGILTMGCVLPEASAKNAAAEIAKAIGLDASNTQHAQLAASAQYATLSSGGVLRLVRDAGDNLVQLLLRLGGGQLPMLLLMPESCIKMTKVLFAESDGALPAVVSVAHSQRVSSQSPSLQQTIQQASTTTSTILLTLAKLFQDSAGSVAVEPQSALTLGGIPASTSLLLPLYYLSLSLHTSASTANNFGILLSSISATASLMNGAGQWQQMNGQTLALHYYTYGLKIDAKHPHLYTNFGSLLKDLNHLNEAIQMYEKAIECNATFDVALANLGNAIKDQGRTQESVQYYRRAVKVNPNFPEALCGLVNALLAVCDWEEVYNGDDEGKGGIMRNVRELLDRQLEDGTLYGARALSVEGSANEWVKLVVKCTGDSRPEFRQYLQDKFEYFYDPQLDRKAAHINEGSFLVRLVERLLRRSQRRWYLDAYGDGTYSDRIQPSPKDAEQYARVPLPSCLVLPAVPTILPFHTFTLKIPPHSIRLISHRNALRISQATLTQSWLPVHVFPPPCPPKPKLKVGYVSSDFNNHPLAHLMQSVFGFHNPEEFEIFLYATTASDQSPYRLKIEKEAQHFLDVSTWSNEDVIKKILDDGIHILMNLNGYTKGARNEIFAARPCPVQMEFMGFAGGLASGWTDWIVVDPIVCPPEMTSTDHWRHALKRRLPRPTDWRGDLDPEDESNEWMYTEKFIYMPDSYFVNDHRQGFREPTEREALDGQSTVRPHEMEEEEAWAEEEERRWKARKEIWPLLPDDYVIFADFNQLYKVEPTLFKLWLRILKRVPNSILWLLRFPAAGEAHLLEYATKHFGPQVASRVIFTEVAPKGVHIHRGRIADLFLDTLECGAHTTSADILWSATPVLTWPKHKHKMASRVAASIVNATGLGSEMIVDSEQAYEDRAVELAQGIRYTYVDAEGNELKTAKSASSTIQADALEINKASSSAMPHSQQTAGNSGQATQPPSSFPSSSSSAAAAAADQSQGTVQADPAPDHVQSAAAEAATLTSESGQPHVNGQPFSTVATQRARITLPTTGEHAPLDTASRRAKGKLAALRKQLFLTRDKNRLFDTKRWVMNLERGYKEAWTRFVDGTDTEESAEWALLHETDDRKKSGHIWIRD